MALEPLNLQHALQIQAGAHGRRRGHEFEASLTELINNTITPFKYTNITDNVNKGNPAYFLLNKALHLLNWDDCDNIEAIELGSLATAENGKQWLKVNGITVKATKSDILLNLTKDKIIKTIGVSVKQCNTKTPTNAQLYFTTAQAFSNLLNNNGIQLSQEATNALKQFCGDTGYRPLDNGANSSNRQTDPRRYFWEEISKSGKDELEKILTEKQDDITKLLLQKAYLNDPFSPELLIHKTKKIETDPQEYAVYTIEELITLSKEYAGFEKKLYSVKKGQYKDPKDVQHEAPRFGIVQMQRGGQKQHPTQLQFNLQAGYFYKI